MAQQLNLAVSTLCDEAKRAAYDLSLRAAVNTQRQEQSEKPAQKQSHDQNQRPSEPDQRPHSAGTKNQSGHQSNYQSRSRTNAQASTAHPTLPVKAACAFCRSTQADAWTEGAEAYDVQRECTSCGAAATPIKMLSETSGRELRRIHRQSHPIVASVWHTWPQAQAIEVMMIDFSPVGCALDCADDYAHGHILKVQTSLFNAICQVCDCRPSANASLSTLGLKFLTLNLYTSPGSFLSARV